MAERKRLYAFDTSIMLLYCGAAPVERDEPERLEQFIEEHRSKHRLAVPAPVLAECPKLALPHGYEGLDLTIEAALLAQRFIPEIKSRAAGTTRRAIKLDALILATAAAHGANVLFTSNERDFVKLLKHMPERKITIEKLPPLRAWQPEIDFPAE